MLGRVLGRMRRQDDTDIEVEETAVELIDLTVVEGMFDQIGIEHAIQLVEQSFVDFDAQIRRLHEGASREDWPDCLSALHGMKGIAVDWGAIALTDAVIAAKQALLEHDLEGLATILLNLVDLQRKTRSALLVHLAKCAAVWVAKARPNGLPH